MKGTACDCSNCAFQFQAALACKILCLLYIYIYAAFPARTLLWQHTLKENRILTSMSFLAGNASEQNLNFLHAKQLYHQAKAPPQFLGRWSREKPCSIILESTKGRIKRSVKFPNQGNQSSFGSKTKLKARLKWISTTCLIQLSL